MSPILASALTEKPVCSVDGRQLGTVRNLTMNPQTGRLESVLVDTDRSDVELRQIPRTPDGELRIAAGAIVGVDDQLVVSLSESDAD
ncbi:PRC domain protein [Natrialba magadii ATCC 43099]|nr:PRC-barrel domain-containing protein [Natrialba magadii]ADD05431.1 PRC domain protein [Natrialba magadii ATCC 43099]